MKELIYRVLNLLTIGKGINRHISGITLRVPTRYYKYFEPAYELNNFNFINNHLKPGMTCVDVGSHIGLLSVAIAKKIAPNGKVYAFEPTPSTFDLLKQTIKINHFEGIIVPLQKAVSDKSGTASFYITDIPAHNSNSLANYKRVQGKETTIEVPLISIDELAAENNFNALHLIKIDAEGAELSVLKGASNVIDKYHPKIILGLHPATIVNFGHSLTEIWDYVKEKGYKVVFENDEIRKEAFISNPNLFDVFLL